MAYQSDQESKEERRMVAALRAARDLLIDRGAGGRRSGPLPLQGDHEATDVLRMIESALGIP